jgi:hypothetical protein
MENGKLERREHSVQRCGDQFSSGAYQDFPLPRLVKIIPDFEKKFKLFFGWYWEFKV